MAFQLSPGVNVSEIDATTVIPTVSTTVGAVVGQFVWGPLETRQLVDSEVKLAAWFGKPDSNTFVSFFSASNFLAYGNQLRVTRAANVESFNAVANTTGPLQIKNETQYETNWYDGSGDFGAFAARYPGSLGNTLKTSVCGSANAFSSNVSELTAETVDGAFSVGASIIDTTGDVTSALVVGDFVKLGDNDYIQVSAVTAANITIVSGLTVALSGNEYILRKWEYADEFDGAPGTSDYATARNGADDELHVIVVDEDGQLSGVRGDVLEKYPFVSKGSDAKSNDGTSIYYPVVIFNKSKWIYWGDHDTDGTNWGNTVQNTTFDDVLVPLTDSLTSGTDQTVTNGDLERAWDIYVNADVVDVSLLVTGEAEGVVGNYVIQNVAEVRKDCVAFVGPSKGAVVDNVGSEADGIVAERNALFTSSSYAVMDGNWKYQYDKYNDTYRWLPLNGDIAGLCVRTDTTRDPWFSPAGYDRGQIKNVIKLAWNPSQAERDQLYKNGVNPVVTFPGDGTLLYGDKTLQSKPSAFDRINVRRLFIVLEKAIARASKFQLFEFNDEFTRAQFVAMVEPFLRDVQGRRGIFDFRVVADETNNTAEVIDGNRFVGDIYVKPARSINFIQLNFVAVRTGVSFDEIVGKF